MPVGRRSIKVSPDFHRRVLSRYREEFEQGGYRAPLLTAVVYCERHKLKVPGWMRLGLAKAFAIHLGQWINDRWEADLSGAVLGRKRATGKLLQKPPPWTSLDARLGIYGRSEKWEAGLKLWPYVEKVEDRGLCPPKGSHSNLIELATKYSRLTDLTRIDQIIEDSMKSGNPKTFQAAAFELAESRGDDAPKFYGRMKQANRALLKKA